MSTRHRLISRLAMLVGTLTLQVQLAAQAGEFPYVAYVNEPETYVRSGPGNQHYPTGQLPIGFAVEVYRHDGEGWCAIRPPDGSFSVAPAHQLKILDSRTAEVTASGVVARVGSGLGQQLNAVQVLLERGEAVQLVAQPTPGAPWVKIAPPAGEFRWIASRRLSRTPPTEGATATSGDKKWQTQSTSSSDANIAATGNPFGHLSGPVTSAAASSTNDAYPAWHPETTVPPAGGGTTAAAAGADQIEVVAGSPAEVVLTQHQEPAAGPGSAALTDASGQLRVRLPGHGSGSTASGAPLDGRIAEMQLRLSQIVVQPPITWQLTSLREETAAQLAQEQSPQVREQLRDLLDRVATFETVQARYLKPGTFTPTTIVTAPAQAAPLAQQIAGAPAAPGLTGQTSDVLARVRSDLGVDPSITPTPGTQPALAAAPAATEALYDAVGTLKPVVSKREQAPRYALVDDHGNVVTFVTASSDVNLQPYIGKRIGVRGNRGFMPEYRRAHVTASRITPLEEKLVR